jgi:hypothetical protein
MHMATAGRTLWADRFFELATTPPRRGGIAFLALVAFGRMVACAEASCRSALRLVSPALAPRLLTLSAISCAMAVGGCAANTAQREAKADPVQAAPVQTAAPADRYPEYRIRRPARALLTPQPAPDCEFGRSDLKTVDPEAWARLKLDYERQCYLRAEKIARNRLRLLQASSMCELVR